MCVPEARLLLVLVQFCDCNEVGWAVGEQGNDDAYYMILLKTAMLQKSQELVRVQLTRHNA